MKEKVLSVFIDESGDFGPMEKHCQYYIVSMVVHDQSKDITKDLSIFENRLSNIGFPKHTVHTAPLIRADIPEYEGLPLLQRQKIFLSTFTLAYKLPINYLSATLSKEKGEDEISLSDKITKAISLTLKANYEYFSSFDRIILYYDNGQVQLTKILIAVFNALFFNIEYRKVIPSHYRLFQIADLFCTLELIEAKRKNSNLSHSELEFFGSRKKFKHDFYSQFNQKKLKNN